MKIFLKQVLVLGFLFFSSLVSQAQVCDILEPICTSQDGLNNTASDPSPIPIVGSCVTIDGNRVAWYFILIDEVSTFTFQIEPTTTNDYDFAVWLNADCDNMPAPIRTNYSGTPGNTGLSTASGNTCQGAGGSPQSSAINVVPGDEIIIAVDRFSASFNMFDLTFGEPDALDCSVVGSQLCEGDTETLDATDPLATNYQWSFDDGMGGGPVIIFDGPGFNTIDVTDTGFYQVIISLPSGATNTEQFDVVFNPFPVIANPGNQTACDSFTLPAIATLVTDAYAPEYRTASQAAGGGTLIPDASVITATQDIWIFDTSPMPSNCSDEEVFRVTINQTPVLNAGLDTSVCSEEASGITLSGTAASSAIASYNITAINTNGLTASAGVPATGTGFTATEIIDDAFTNNTAANVDVVYTIVPVGTNTCVGAPVNVTLTVEAAPVLNPNLDAVACSDVASGINLGVTATSPPAATYNITAINTNGLTASSGTPVVANNLPSTEIADDAYTNSTNATVNVVYTIVPVSASGCEGAAVNVTLTVQPQPILSTTLDTTVCSDTLFWHYPYYCRRKYHCCNV